MNFVFPHKRNQYQQFMDWNIVFVYILSTILNISWRYDTAVNVITSRDKENVWEIQMVQSLWHMTAFNVP